MRGKILILLAILVLAGFPLQAGATVPLGAAGGFAVLAGSSVINTGLSVIDGGKLGVSPSSAIMGFPPGIVMPPFTIHLADPIAINAQSALTTAFNAAAGAACTMDLTGQNLGGMTLTAGVYCLSTSAQLTGTLTLDAQGNPNAEFIFQIGSTLITAASSSVQVINAGGMLPGSTVFWQVGSSATIGAGTAFLGHILAQESITLGAGATILGGSALARTGSVTLDTNSITGFVDPATAVEAASWGAIKSLFR